MKAFIYPILILLIACALSSSGKAQFLVDVEGGIAFTGRNDVRVPGDVGTFFSMKDDLISAPTFYYRVVLGVTIKSRHTLSLLFAPLQTNSKGSKNEDILFEGVVFPANTELEGIYKFNSYRFTYRYDIVKKPRIEFGLGLTAKIRDAKIALSSSELASEKTNVGFVPLINFRLLWYFGDQVGLLLYGDALAAPQGRAEDVQIAVLFDFSERFSLRAGYRILEGGADNSEVYNFSLFHYAAVGITYSFKKRE
jgi:hypothetical protein